MFTPIGWMVFFGKGKALADCADLRGRLGWQDFRTIRLHDSERAENFTAENAELHAKDAKERETLADGADLRGKIGMSGCSEAKFHRREH